MRISTACSINYIVETRVTSNRSDPVTVGANITNRIKVEVETHLVLDFPAPQRPMY